MEVAIVGGWKEKGQTRLAMICENEAEARQELDATLEKVNDNLWKHYSGQEFWIITDEQEICEAIIRNHFGL